MKLSAPTTGVFWIAVVLAVVGVLLTLGVVPPFGVPAVWLVTAGFVVLMVGNLFKGW
ncbi:MAG: hypothetical protein AAGD06_00320 [Acidobacteriota bacterium]